MYEFTSDPEVSWEIVTTDTLEATGRELADAKVFSADVETNGLEVHKGDHSIGYCFAWRRANGQLRSVYLPMRHKSHLGPFDVVTQLDPAHAIDAVRPALEGPGLKCGHNLAFDVGMFRGDGIEICGPVHDTMIAAQLMNENHRSYRLNLCLERDRIVHQRGWKGMIKPDQAAQAKALKINITTLRAKHGYEFVTVDHLGLYGVQDGAYELRLAEYQFPFICRWEEIWKLEMELFWVCADMQRIGVPLAPQVLVDLAAEQQAAMDGLAPKIWSLAGEEFEITNDTALRRILFEKLGYEPKGKTKGGAKQPVNRVDDDALWSLEKHDGSEIAALVRQFNSADKVVSTYTSGIISCLGSDGLLHGEVKQSGAKTGRVSMSKPNLQNIPVRTELGRRVREAFVVRPGMIRYCVDYSQIELRVLAHLSQDPLLLKVYRQDLDAHATTSIEAFGTAGKVNGVDMRRVAKCFHPDTEVLTKRGWSKIVDLLEGEEVLQAMPATDGAVSLGWVVPTEVFTKPNRYDHLIHLQNEGVDLRVTPDHRMVGWGSSGEWSVRMPAEFSKFRYWANAGVISSGLPVRTPEEVLRLAVAVQADGSYTGRQIRFGFTKARKIDRLRSMLEAFPGEWAEGVYSQGVTTFTIRPALASRIQRLLDGKSLPWAWLNFPPALRSAVVEEARHWDAHKATNWRMYSYGSTDLQSAEVLQALAAITGRKTRLVEGLKNGTPFFTLSVRDRATTRGESVSSEAIPYTGVVACLSVPSSFVLVRDGGVPVITGQTLNFGIPFGITARGVQRNINKDLPDGVEEIDGEKASSFLLSWYAKYVGVDKYRRGLWYQTQQSGGLFHNLFGRPRRVPDIRSSEKWRRAAAERQITSSMVQGSAADLVKHSMLECWKYLKAQTDCEAHMVIMVHDDLQFDMRPEGSAKVIRELTRIMESTCQHKLSVPIKVDTEYFTDHWGNKKAMK